MILAVASGAIGLGNFLRFPGQVVQNGGGAFMVPYILSFLLLGLPVCLSEWAMGRMAGKQGHSAPFIYRVFLKGPALYVTGAIGIMVPILIYVYYIFIESWCLAYAFYFFTGKEWNDIGSSQKFFGDLTGSDAHGNSFNSSILLFFFIAFAANFILVQRGLAKGLEAFAKLAIPIMALASSIVLIRVLTIPGISSGLAVMWNPDWSSLSNPKVWLNAAGQVFFSLSTGFGIALVFSSFLKEKDDVVLSSMTSASINEFAEVVFGGLITIPIVFLFLGISATQFGTFGMGFVALPTVFGMMPWGQFFGFLWFLVLFLAALTSSVTMLQPGVLFLEEGFGINKKNSVAILMAFTLACSLPIVYFNKDFMALDVTDFYVGTILIYVLATIQIFIFVFKIGVEKGAAHASLGSLIPFPKIIQWITIFITPWVLLLVFLSFCYLELPKQFEMLGSSMTNDKGRISQYILLCLLGIFIIAFFIVRHALKRKESSGIS